MTRPILFVSLFLSFSFFAACGPLASAPTQASTSASPAPASTFTPIPTLTHTPEPTATPLMLPGTAALDFSALLCNAKWMTGSKVLKTCPGPGAYQSDGMAVVYNPAVEGFPSDTPSLLMIPNANALFLRYPPFTVLNGDRFRTTLLCPSGSTCDVQFALEYFDGNGKLHELFAWDHTNDQPPISVDADL